MEELTIQEDVYQDSVLSLYLFPLVMNQIMEDIWYIALSVLVYCLQIVLLVGKRVKTIKLKN